MTRRERLERRMERREEWAAGAGRKSAAAFDGVQEICDRIPFGQPILVGHHSERRARKDQERIRRGMTRGVELGKLADHHDAKAGGLAAQLDRSIFSDDADAIAQLEQRIAEREANRERGKRLNAAWRKAGKPDPLDADAWAAFVEKVGAEDAAAAEHGLRYQRRADVPGLLSWAKPYDPTHDGANIRRDQERIQEIARRRERQADAEIAGGVIVQRFPDDNWCQVTFAEKPDRAILDDLKAAGYAWGAGRWLGRLDKLPASVATLA